MSWQDELQQLDSALAAGQISADEYRVRRDQVLAQASGQQATPTPQAERPPEPTQIVQPSGGQQQGPAPDERTQFVPANHGRPGDTADKTQVVTGSDDSADSTQVVAGEHTGTPPPGFPPPQPPLPWETARPQQDPRRGQPVMPPVAPPPWANEDLPPEFGMQGWPRQGPEIFEQSGGGGTGKIIAIVLAVVVVLAGGAVAFFVLRSNNTSAEPQQPPPTTASSPTTTSSVGPKLPEGPFVKMDGKEKDNKNVPIDEAVHGKVPTEQEATLLKAQGVTSVGMYVTTEGDLVRAVWSFTPAQGGDPKALLAALDDYFTKGGHKELSGVPDGVIGRTKPATESGTRTAFRAFYIAEGVVLQIEAYAPDEVAARDAFVTMLDDQVKAFPPSR